jgi:hypothetical protein
VNGRKTAVFVRESLMLETRGSRNLGNTVNPVYSLEEFCPSHSVFLDEQHYLCALSPLSSKWGKHWSSSKRSIFVTSKRVLHCVRHGELS